MRVNLHQRLVRSSFEFVVRIEIASDTVEQQDNLTFIRETVLLTSGQARAERSAPRLPQAVLVAAILQKSAQFSPTPGDFRIDETNPDVSGAGLCDISLSFSVPEPDSGTDRGRGAMKTSIQRLELR